MTTPFEEGSPTSEICFLGEAPGRTEMRLGQPLVGPSGDVFNQCLRTEGIPRNRCYILNVWPFQVWKEKKGIRDYLYPYAGPRHEDTCLWITGMGFTDYGLECAKDTIERLKNCHANVIVTLGQQALDLCTGISKSIMKQRGSILEGRLDRVGGSEAVYNARKVIPTVHPAATLHGTYLWRYLIMADMRRAKEEAESPALKLPERQFLLEPSLRQVREYIEICRRAGIVATDLEVVNHHVSCFSLCYTPQEAMTVPFLWSLTEDYWDEDEEIEVWKAYASLMQDPNVKKVNQNLIGFDAPFLLVQNSIHTKGELCDTMIAQHICYPEFPKGLDFITSIHTREPYYKDEGKQWKTLGDIDTFWRYCAKDACVALEAWQVLYEEMKQGGFLHTYEMTARMAEPLMYMTLRGMKVDQEKLNETKGDITQKILEREVELEECADYMFNPNSPKQCKEYFYEHKGCTPYKNAQFDVSADDKAMSRIYRKYNLREAKLVQELRNLKKLKSTYLEVELDKDERLRCSWNPRGTWTGRLSSGKTMFGTGMNLQNLDPRFREFIVADEDM